MNSERDLVSVIMGIYNIPSKEVLEMSINSILKQTYKNFEFIIIDDGSTNDTFLWAKALTKNDSRVILKKNEKNMGLVKTLNKALKLSKGKYIARMDGDDYCSLDRLEKQIMFLNNNKEYGLVGCNMNKFDENGIWGERISSEIVKKDDFLFTSPISHATILTYKECYDIVNGYREAWETTRNEDYDIFMRMFSKGIKMYTIQEKLYFFREDNDCYNRRKYRYRLCECIVRLKGFYILGLYPKAILYVIKPLVVGFIPKKLLKKIHKRGLNNER